MADLIGFKEYARVMPDEDDAAVRLYFEAAQQYIGNAGVPVPETPNELYDLLVYALGQHWYDNRGVVVVGTTRTNLPFAVEAMILQLRSVADGEKSESG